MTDPSVRDFEELVVRYQDVVCAVAYSVLRDRARSEEVAQDAFLVAWQKLPGLTPPPAMPGWLCGVTRNLALNAARRRKETVMVTEPMSASHATPLSALLVREADVLAERALASLSPQDREVVVLYYRRDGTVGAVYLASGGTASAGAIANATRPVGSLGRAIAIPLAAITALAVVWGVHRVTRSDDASPSRAPIIVPGSWTTPVRPITAPQRAALLERIHAARTARVARAASVAPAAAGGAAAAPDHVKVYDFAGGRLDALAAPPAEARAPGPLTKRDLRWAIQSVQPMLLECYTAAVDRLPRTDGTMTVVVRFAGEADVGSLIDSTRLEGDAHLLADSELAECMNETLMAIELPAMEDGGLIDVHYPFVVGAP